MNKTNIETVTASGTAPKIGSILDKLFPTKFTWWNRETQKREQFCDRCGNVCNHADYVIAENCHFCQA